MAPNSNKNPIQRVYSTFVSCFSCSYVKDTLPHSPVGSASLWKRTIVFHYHLKSTFSHSECGGGCSSSPHCVPPLHCVCEHVCVCDPAHPLPHSSRTAWPHSGANRVPWHAANLQPGFTASSGFGLFLLWPRLFGWLRETSGGDNGLRGSRSIALFQRHMPAT